MGGLVVARLEGMEEVSREEGEEGDIAMQGSVGQFRAERTAQHVVASECQVSHMLLPCIARLDPKLKIAAQCSSAWHA